MLLCMRVAALRVPSRIIYCSEVLPTIWPHTRSGVRPRILSMCAQSLALP